MKPMLSSRDSIQGFALPTVILASVIMLIVLVTSVTAVGSVTTALAGQYYGQVAREAAESGLAAARACLRDSNYTATWSTASPLKPNTDCTGGTLGSMSAYVVNASNVRSSYVVNTPDTGAAGYIRVVATGTVELVRASTGQVWRTYTYTGAENSRYNDMPQIAGGAGWKGTGHDGYMLASTGVLYGWGDNSSQQLGDTSLGSTVTLPTKITLPDGVSRAKKVFNSGQGASVLCILATHSTLGDQIYCRGFGLGLSGGWQRFGLTAGLTAIDLSLNGYGSDSACVKASDLQAYCSGLNDSGGLGTGTTSSSFVPIGSPVKFRLDLANPGPVSGSASSLTVQKVFTQDRVSCVIASDNQAYCAGENIYGQLGQGNFTTNVWQGKSIPGRALIPGAPTVTNIVLPYHGAEEGVFFHVNNPPNTDVFMSGHNGYGTANDGAFSGSCAASASFNCYNIPRQITTGTFGKVISIGEAGGDRHGICVVTNTTWCIGSNTFGELGTGSCTNRASWFGPLNLGGELSTPAMNVESTYQMNSVMVMTTGGNVYAMGDNTYGKLGTGAALGACNPTPAKVQLPAGVLGVALANGDEYTSFVLGDNGRVYAMGRNNNGQLGDGTTTDRNVPVEVKIPRQETIY